MMGLCLMYAMTTITMETKQANHMIASLGVVTAAIRSINGQLGVRSIY